jgi:hypothetical protein
MARKRTREALATLESALDPHNDGWDYEFASGLPDDLRERLSDAVFDANRAIQAVPKSDGRGRRRPRLTPTSEAINDYLFLNPPPPGQTHFDRDLSKKVFAKSVWAQAFAAEAQQLGLSIEQAKYIFDERHYEPKRRAKKKAAAKGPAA